MTPENAVKKHIKEILDEWGAFFWMTGPTLYGRVGVSDFLAIYEGTVLAIEAKATKHEKPTPLQQRFLDGVLKAKGVALVIHNENYDMLTSALRRLAHKEKF